MAGVAHLKRICKDAFSVAGGVQETCSSEMLGCQRADFLREVAFWSIRSSCLLRWLCVDGMEKLQDTLVGSRRLCTQLSIFEGGLAELLRFWCFQLRKLRTSRRTASFFMLSSQKLRKSRRVAAFLVLSQVKKWRKSARIASFSSLQIDR